MNRIPEFLWHSQSDEARKEAVNELAQMSAGAAIGAGLSALCALTGVAGITTFPLLSGLFAQASAFSFLLCRDIYVISGNCKELSVSSSDCTEAVFNQKVFQDTWAIQPKPSISEAV